MQPTWRTSPRMQETFTQRWETCHKICEVDCIVIQRMCTTLRKVIHMRMTPLSHMVATQAPRYYTKGVMCANHIPWQASPSNRVNVTDLACGDGALYNVMCVLWVLSLLFGQARITVCTENEDKIAQARDRVGHISTRNETHGMSCNRDMSHHLHCVQMMGSASVHSHACNFMGASTITVC